MGHDGSLALRFFGDVGFAALFLLNAALALLLGLCFIRAARQSLSSGRSVTTSERFLWQAILCALPIYLLLPGTALGVSDPGARLLQCALALALMLIPRTSLPLRASAVGAAALSLTGLFLFGRLACSAPPAGGAATRLPHSIAIFNHVAYLNQDGIYRALESGNISQPVFATSIFDNLPRVPQMRPAQRTQP